MRILQIPNYYYPHIGGIEQVARDIACSFPREIEQQILCYDDIPCAEPEKKGSIIKSNIDGVNVTRCRTVTKLFSQSISFSANKALKQTLADFKPDIVILHFPNPLMSTCLMKYLKENFRLYIYWHSDIVKQKIIGKAFEGQTIKLLDRAEKIVATSPNYIDGSSFLSKYRDKVTVIPNCISTERLKVTNKIEDKAKSIRKEYSDKTICFAIGRHVPYKGYSSLVKAAKLVDDNIQIIIGGKGPLTEKLKEEAANTPVQFVGRLSDEDLVANYLASDIILFPSITKNEAFGISLAEGMYFGKPAITYSIPGSGVNYVSLDGITGIECPNQDHKEYAKAINKLSRDKDLRDKYGNNAKKRVVDNFLLSKFKIEINELIK